MSTGPRHSILENRPSLQVVKIIPRILAQQPFDKTLSMDQPCRLVTEPAARGSIDFSEKNREFTVEIIFGCSAAAIFPHSTRSHEDDLMSIFCQKGSSEIRIACREDDIVIRPTGGLLYQSDIDRCSGLYYL